MKTIRLLIILLNILVFACEKESVDSYIYDSLHFKRTGAGNIEFNVFPTKNPDQLSVVINKYSFKDTTIKMTLDYSADYSLAFSSFKEAMQDQVVLTGDYKQPTGMTGTWTYVYLVKNNLKTEVTNTDLRINLVSFEQMVKTKLK